MTWSPTPSRRSILRGSLAAGAAAAGALAAPSAGAAPRATPMGLPRATAPTRADVVVVGAGLSGLATARQLVAKGVDVVVVEARSRAGGRVHSITTPGGRTLDAGAEFVGPTQDTIIALADGYGAKRLPTYNQGDNIWWFNGKKQRYPSWGTPIDLGGIGAGAAILEMSTIALGFPVGHPWDHWQARALDAMTWQDWINKRVVLDSAKSFLSQTLSSVLSVHPREVSALYMLNYVAAAGNEKTPGNWFRLLNVKDGAQEQFIEGGAAQIPLAMARDLGSRVVYDAPVRAIKATSDTAVEVVTGAGTISATKVVVAMSPAICDRIDFQPGLPDERVQLQRGYTMGRIGKFHAVYERPWWREQGYSGQTIGNGTPIDVTFESYGDGHHVLMGFVSADAMTALDGASPAAFRDACLTSLAAYFGPQVRTYVDWGEYRWDRQEWSWGGPVAVTGPGTLTKYGRALRKPVGPIHWAGTETADWWTGYMDGAVRSGYRAADEVAALL